MVFQKDKNGVLQPFLTGTGKQAVFKPDFQTSSTYLELLKEFGGDKEAAMLAAKNRRKDTIAQQELSDKMYGAPR